MVYAAATINYCTFQIEDIEFLPIDVCREHLKVNVITVFKSSFHYHEKNACDIKVPVMSKIFIFSSDPIFLAINFCKKNRF